MKATLYEHWNAGRIGQFGSFQTTLFFAYRLADQGNRALLDAAWPAWFTEPFELTVYKYV